MIFARKCDKFDQNSPFSRKMTLFSRKMSSFFTIFGQNLIIWLRNMRILYKIRPKVQKMEKEDSNFPKFPILTSKCTLKVQNIANLGNFASPFLKIWHFHNVKGAFRPKSTHFSTFYPISGLYNPNSESRLITRPQNFKKSPKKTIPEEKKCFFWLCDPTSLQHYTFREILLVQNLAKKSGCRSLRSNTYPPPNIRAQSSIQKISTFFREENPWRASSETAFPWREKIPEEKKVQKNPLWHRVSFQHWIPKEFPRVRNLGKKWGNRFVRRTWCVRLDNRVLEPFPIFR